MYMAVALLSFARIWEECSTCLHFFFFFGFVVVVVVVVVVVLFLFFVFEVNISSRTLISLFMPGSVHSGSTS